MYEEIDISDSVKKQLDLTGRTAVITGGAGFLGLQFAEAIAEMGGKTILVDIDQKQLKAAENKLKQAGFHNVAVHAIDITDEIEFGDELDLIKAAVKIMQPDYGFELETYAEFDPGTGLGGSSAVVVSVLGALNFFRNEQQLDIYQLADLAYQVERIEMNIQGGWQDQYATTFGGFSWIEFRQNEVLVSPLLLQRDTQLELEYNLMLFRKAR